MKKNITIGLMFVAIVALGWMIVTNKQAKMDSQIVSVGLSNNVSTEDSKQVIEITAKGGYEPRISTAKANMPTILRVKTTSTFDCSSALRIPSLGYSKNLPPTGTTDIEVPAQAAGTTLKALCSMGMYNFSVQFQG